MAPPQHCLGMGKSEQLPGSAAKRRPALRRRRRRIWAAQVQLEAVN
jgi:hypothetical protein